MRIQKVHLSLPIPNRHVAGEALAQVLKQRYGQRDDIIVLALPRGGVPVAVPIVRALRAPLDLMLVRKLGVPYQPELAMGAIASGGVRVLNPEVVRMTGVTPAQIEAVAAEEQQEMDRRAMIYRGNRPWPDLTGRCVILVDDGLATGATMRAAIKAVRHQDAVCIVVAVPVAPPDTVSALAKDANEVISLFTPEPFSAIGQWYEDFSQTSDEEVIEALRELSSREGE